MPPLWLLHPELSSSKILPNSSNTHPFFCPLWLTDSACFSIFCMILTTVRVLMDPSFIKKSSLTFGHQGNVLSSLKTWISLEDWWVYTGRKRPCLRRILGRIKRELITRLGCQSDLTSSCLCDLGQLSWISDSLCVKYGVILSTACKIVINWYNVCEIALHIKFNIC